MSIVVIIIIAAAAVYFLGVAGGGGSTTPTTSMSSNTTTTPTTTTAGPPVTVNFYEALAASEAAYFSNTLVPQFESANPNIKVNLVNVGSAGDVVTDVKALVQGNNPGTTLVGLDNLAVGELVYANALMDMTPMLSSMEPPGLISSAQQMVSYEQSVYSATYFIPFRSNIPLTFYSKTAFSSAGISSPPTTAAQLMSDAQTLKNAGYTGSVMFQGSGRDASAPTELYQWIVQFGGNPFLLNDSGSVQTFQYMYNLSAYFNPDYVNGYWGSYVGLSNGQYQILNYQWPYVYNLLTNSTLGMTTSTLGVYPGPHGPVNSNHVLGGDVLVIPKGATNLDAVAKLANFLLGSQAQTETLLHLSWVAVNSAAYTNLPGNFSDVGQALLAAINEGVFLRNPAPWISQWNSLCTDAWNKIVVQHASYSSIQSILNSENNQMYQYLVSNYGAQTAQQYEQNVFKPISVS